MKQSLIYLFLFVAGILLAIFVDLPDFLVASSFSKWVLYLLILLIGIQLGSGKNLFKAAKAFGGKIVLVPIATIIGTFAAVSLVSIFLPHRSLTDCLSVGAGFAYYSLSSVLITEARGAELGALALIANIIREFCVLIFAPLMVKYFGKLAPINAGGATTLDVTLPVILKYSGQDFLVISAFHGMFLDMSVMLFVPLFLSL